MNRFITTLISGLISGSLRRRNAMAGLTGLLLGSVAGYLLIVGSDRNAPVVVHDEREVDGHAARDGHIDIFVELDRLRDCPSETSRWLWTWVEHDGQRLRQYFPLFSSAANVTDAGRGQRFIVSIPIPPGVWPGLWFYWSKTTAHCSLLPSLFRPTILESGNIPIRITEAGEQ